MQYPSSVVWQIDMAATRTLDQLFGRERAKRVIKASALLEKVGYRMGIEPVTPAYLDHFIPAYQHHIGAMSNGLIFDVRGHIRRGWDKGRTYEAVFLRQDERFLGGMIYSVMPTVISVAYRMFPPALAIKLPIGCSFVAERLLVERAWALGQTSVWHGQDRNIYGVNLAIGVAMYKGNVGCRPFVSRVASNTWHEVSTLSLQQEAFVLLGMPSQRAITEGLLITNKSADDVRRVYGALLNHPTLRVTVRPYGGSNFEH